MLKKTMGLLAALCALSACANEVDVTYNCVPAGATVFQEGIGVVGTCPVTLKYSEYDSKISGNRISTDKIRVVWISGASMMVPPTVLNITNHEASMTFVHPPGTPDYAQDEAYATQLDESLTPPGEKYIVTPDQNRDVFDSFNNKVTCGFDNAIESVGSKCN